MVRHIHAELDSTLSEAARIAPSLSSPAWILALRQTAGRGRRGRAWEMPAGNFAATLVMRPAEAPEKVALRSFVAALALRDAFVEACGLAQPFALKWPNDVLLNGGKVAGILLESAGTGGSVSHVAIGIGVNLAAIPPVEVLEPGAVAPVSLAGETGVRIAPEEFLTLLARAYARWEGALTTYGFGPVRTAWLSHAARLGEKITARTLSESVEGVFETVDESGALILRTQTARRVIPAAEVFF